jgi:hypothetical protein
MVGVLNSFKKTVFSPRNSNTAWRNLVDNLVVERCAN